MIDEWTPFFDPKDPGLYVPQGDVDWMSGTWASRLDKPTAVEEVNPWLPGRKSVAEGIVRQNRDKTRALLFALLSWRSCTVKQLQAGLCATKGMPDFDREHPNLYGALCRLGCVSIGFSMRERFERVRVPQVWLSMNGRKENVARVCKLIGLTAGERESLTSTRAYSAHANARHNTFASHVGLTFAHDDRARLTAGDGWGLFRTIDPIAKTEAGIGGNLSGTDVIALCRNNTLACVEVQMHYNGLFDKLQRWAKLLAFSPMRRRGIVNVWLFAPMNRGSGQDKYGSMENMFHNAGAYIDVLGAGTPSVATRMGYAYWTDWYENGHPTERFGTYTDMNGARRSIYDPQWKHFTPATNPVTDVTDWGWKTMRDQLHDYWGVDATRWTMPEMWRGGFEGFIGKDTR